MEEKKELIVIKQLPIIEERLKSLSVEIDNEVANALSLVVSDDTVKDVKKVRAELNANFKELEAQRKLVKEKVLAPYQAFEDVYKIYVSDKFKKADNDLKIKIDEVEAEQKKLKLIEVEEYYSEYAKSKDLDWLINEDYYKLANINITLSASMKSLKEQAKSFIDRVVDDLKLIDTQEYKAEILAEYKISLNVSNAITNVTDRFKREEEEKKKIEELQQVKIQEEQVVERVDEVLQAPIEEKTTIDDFEEKEEVYEMTFTVKSTLSKLKELKNYLIKGGYINE